MTIQTILAQLHEAYAPHMHGGKAEITTPTTVTAGEVTITVTRWAKLNPGQDQAHVTLSITSPHIGHMQADGWYSDNFHELEPTLEEAMNRHAYKLHATRAKALAEKRAQLTKELRLITDDLVAEINAAAKPAYQLDISTYQLAADTTPSGHTNWQTTIARWLAPVNQP